MVTTRGSRSTSSSSTSAEAALKRKSHAAVRKPKAKPKTKPPQLSNSAGKTVNQLVFPYRDSGSRFKAGTFGKHLCSERNKLRKAAFEANMATVGEYEAFDTFSKVDVLRDMEATVHEDTEGRQVATSRTGLRMIFLTLASTSQTTHMCNHKNLQMDLAGLENSDIRPASICMGFAKGEHVEGTTVDGDQHVYLGLLGITSTSSSGIEGHRKCTACLAFDFEVSKTYVQELFGAHVVNCKMSKYGVPMCSP